jgi:aldehyde dehydrogenase (NAD+)
MAKMKETIIKFYGEKPDTSPDYCRIVTTGHCERLCKLLESSQMDGAKCFTGGNVKPDDRYIEPTILTDVSLDNRIMKEEIFGPILPVLTYSTPDQAIKLMKQSDLENPLVIYLFSKNKALNDRIIYEVPSGGVLVNDVLFHYANYFLPFGGVGTSGMGNYRGNVN